MLSLDKFLSLLERSGLVEADRLSQAVADWKSKATLAQLSDAEYCAEHLVNRGVLTNWQSKKLLDGRYRGFFLGKYKLLDHLGSGGMSSVYLAEHVLMQRRVAIKVLPQNRVTDSTYLARFHLEAQAVAALDHPNIVRAYDLDSEGKIHYLVMEYVEGRDLHAAVCHDGPLDYHVAADYIAQAAAGLEHAHHAGLVHRDVKPANLLVDRKQTVKVLDMGLAKFTGAARPEIPFSPDEQVLGTADYLAPEQAVNSQTVDQRADIYSLGCTLYFVLTGHPPFAEGTSLERMTAHQQQHPPSILLDRADAPAELVAICRRMMEKSPESRYQSARDVQQALRGWLAGATVAGKARVAVSAGGGRGPRGPGESKANLVSGSGPDLRSATSEQSRNSSALTDTNPNLHQATVEIPAQALRSPSESSRHLAPGSEVLPLGVSAARDSTTGSNLAMPVAPPVDIPPVPSSHATIVPLPVAHSAPADDAPIIALPIGDDPAIALPDAPLGGMHHRHAKPHTPWALIVSALLLAALLAALFALG